MDCAKIHNLIFFLFKIFLSGEQLVSVGMLFKFLFKKLILCLISEKEGVRERKECAQEEKKIPRCVGKREPNI